MPNMSLNKMPIKEQEPDIRNKNFNEVCLGYDETSAQEEADRCLNCQNMPCVEGCPVKVLIPKFIECIKEGNFDKSYQIIANTNNLPAICGRVCPQESQCEAKCIRGIKGDSVAIGKLERFAADRFMKNRQSKVENRDNNNSKVAIIGSGPAGITCAGDLAKMGYNVTVFEAFHVPGGVLMYGIPEFRLPKEIVKNEIQNIKNLGVNIECNVIIGKTLNIDDLFKDGYKAVFIGTGAGLPDFMDIEGEFLNGVYSANEFLTRVNLMGAYKYPDNHTPVKIGANIAVIGGGNVAMDAARCAKRLGANKVQIIYRRSESEMPARNEEIIHAKEEGIQFEFYTAPIKIIGNDGWVNQIECIKMELGEPDNTGRRKPIPIEDSNFLIDVDTVIIAIGQRPNPLIIDTENIESSRGCIVVDEDGKTNIEGVFAGGDIVSGAATVILAMGAGKKAALAIDEYIKAKE